MSVMSSVCSSVHALLPRAEHDFYATDPECVRQLLAVETFAPRILEPCCGQGHISRTLEAHGHTVISNDLYDHGFGNVGVDFLKWRPGEVPLAGVPGFDIITNPPYRYATEFVLHALDVLPLYHRVAFLLHIQFLESASRYRALWGKDNALERVYVASVRVNCAKNGDFGHYNKASAACYAWFIWRKGFSGEPTIRWFNTPSPAKPIQKELPL